MNEHKDEPVSKKKVGIIGGGAAGYFFAANAAKMYPDHQFVLYEQAKTGLQKVKVSGGGRCNVTHACFDPKELAINYPRGMRELLGPFHRFGPSDTIQWFEVRDVKLHTEADGRMFPITNSSQTIIDCLVHECEKYGVEMHFQQKLLNIDPINMGDDGFHLHFINGKTDKVDKLMLATGSSRMIWKLLNSLEIEIVPPVPSLFTFKIADERIRDLAGVTVDKVEISLPETSLKTDGPMLITHKGLSGPSVLKLSAFGARLFAERNYQTEITINFLPNLSLGELRNTRDADGKLLLKETKWALPKRLQAKLLASSTVDVEKKWASLSNAELTKLHERFCKAVFMVNGQNTFKEEFVTSGGVDLAEVDFKTFKSKKYQNLYFAGEVLNIDAVTGGFNFQAAWTGAYLAAVGLEE